MKHDDHQEGGDRPGLFTRVGRSLSFMNKLALVLFVIGLLALLVKHH